MELVARPVKISSSLITSHAVSRTVAVERWSGTLVRIWRTTTKGAPPLAVPSKVARTTVEGAFRPSAETEIAFVLRTTTLRTRYGH